MTFNVGELQASLGIDDSGMDSGISSALDKLQEFAARGGALAAAAGAAIGAGLALAIAAAFEADTVTRKIQASLGATEQEAGRLGKAAGSLFAKNYGDSMEEVGDAVVSVVRNMDGLRDVSSDVLESITGQVISLASVFEQDFNAVTRSAGQLLKNGLARNAQEALDIITKGLQSPVNAADDLLDTFDEYSTIFRTLGLDGKDALGLLSQGLKAGARDADQVADSLKEMLLRIQAGDSKQAIQQLGLNFSATLQAISKGGESAKTATDTVLDAFRGIQDPATKASVAVGLFGTKAEDAQKALGNLDVDVAAQQFEDAYGKIAGASAQLDATVGGSLQGAFESVWRSMQGFITEAGTQLGPILSTAADAFAGLFDILRGALEWLGDLPGPVYAIGAAVALWASWGTIAAGASALAASMVALGTAARGLMASLGPIGLLLAGVATAMVFLSDSGDGAEDALEAQTDRFRELRDTLDEATGAITANTRATILQQTAGTGVAETLQKAGISLDLYADAAMGNAQAQEELASQIKAAQNAAVGSEGAFKGMADTLKGAQVSQQELLDAIDSGDWSGVTSKVQAYADEQGRMSGNVDQARTIMDGFTAAMGQAQGPVLSLGGVMIQNGEAADHLSQAQKDAAITAGDFGNSAQAAYDRILSLATISGLSADEIQRMGSEAGLSAAEIESIKAAADSATEGASPLAEALASGASAASEMDAAIQTLQLALDTLAGNTISAEQATRAHEATIRAVASAARDKADADAAQAEAQQKVNDLTSQGITSGKDYDAATRALAEATSSAADAADSQADSLDSLADSAQGMTQRSFEAAGGMDNYDAAVAAATTTMEGQRAQFIQSALAAGRSQEAAEQLADAQGLIPRNVATAYDAIRADQSRRDAQGVDQAVRNIPDSKNVNISISGGAEAEAAAIRREIANIPDSKISRVTVERNEVVYTTASGQRFQFAGGPVGPMSRGLAGGGQLDGATPADPTFDNLDAGTVNGVRYRLQSGEWIQPVDAVKFYGPEFMRAIQTRRFPKPLGLAGGGVPGVSVTAPNVNVGAPVVQVLIDGQDISDRVEVIVDGKIRQTRMALQRKRAQSWG